jgi:hypothetical protein
MKLPRGVTLSQVCVCVEILVHPVFKLAQISTADTNFVIFVCRSGKTHWKSPGLILSYEYRTVVSGGLVMVRGSVSWPLTSFVVKFQIIFQFVG